MKVQGAQQSIKGRGKGMSLQSIVSHFLMTIVGVYIGLNMGMQTCPAAITTTTTATTEEFESLRNQQGEQQQRRQQQNNNQINIDEKCDEKSNTAGKATGGKGKGGDRIQFPDTVNKFILDYATIPRDDFNEELEIGVPIDKTKPGGGHDEVFLLYTDVRTLPFNGRDKQQDHGPKIGIDAKRALKNCHTVRVILQEPARPSKSGKRQCIAIVPQWESWHVHKFMRMPKKFEGKNVDVKYPLRYVSRSLTDNGKINKFPLLQKDTIPSYKALIEYLTHLDRILDDLRPILEHAMDQSKKNNDKYYSAKMKKSKSIVVMVCNRGQAHLFHNFICNARSKGLDVSRIIMFATDMYTYELCKKLNIAVYHDDKIFGDMPENAARRYGDKIFSQMMMAKVYCVHLVMSLGYDVLFQDVDVVWQKNPLEYLVSEEKDEWDMLFQDDGSRQPRYNPYSPNTGFYFVRNNPLTMYFFSSLLRMGDLIHAVKSHQAALAALLAEFASWKGLRVKIWPKGGLFPGGVEYHQQRPYMKGMIGGKIEPYMFHMSWTQNKDNKKLFYEQMGEWYTKEDYDSCNGFDCCLPQANFTCHYRDKPSVKSCKTSPPIDKNGRSFW